MCEVQKIKCKGCDLLIVADLLHCSPENLTRSDHLVGVRYENRWVCAMQCGFCQAKTRIYRRVGLLLGWPAGTCTGCQNELNPSCVDRMAYQD